MTGVRATHEAGIRRAFADPSLIQIPAGAEHEQDLQP
jgi:hypothetical protein